MVCYCFSHDREGIEREIESLGRSLILEEIRTKTRAGDCACGELNPSGGCCLPEVACIVDNYRRGAEG